MRGPMDWRAEIDEAIRGDSHMYLSTFFRLLSDGHFPEETAALLRRAGAGEHHYQPYANMRPTLSVEDLRQLAALDLGPFPNGIVASHPDAPPDVLAELADVADEETRALVAVHPNTEEALRRRLREEASPEMRARIERLMRKQALRADTLTDRADGESHSV